MMGKTGPCRPAARGRTAASLRIQRQNDIETSYFVYLRPSALHGPGDGTGGRAARATGSRAACPRAARDWEDNVATVSREPGSITPEGRIVRVVDPQNEEFDVRRLDQVLTP